MERLTEKEKKKKNGVANDVANDFICNIICNTSNAHAVHDWGLVANRSATKQKKIPGATSKLKKS